MLKSLYVIAVCLLPISLAAQTFPSGEGPRTFIWVGASFSTFNPDYGCGSSSPFSCWESHVMGISPHADTPPFLFNRIGAEGLAHFLVWHGPNGLKESSYLSGPTFRLVRHKDLSVSSKFLVGVGHLEVPAPEVGSGHYFAMAPGANVDYRVTRRVIVRFGYEYQLWPSFKNPFTGHTVLTPNGVSFGGSYALP